MPYQIKMRRKICNGFVNYRTRLLYAQYKEITSKKAAYTHRRKGILYIRYKVYRNCEEIALNFSCICLPVARTKMFSWAYFRHCTVQQKLCLEFIFRLSQTSVRKPGITAYSLRPCWPAVKTGFHWFKGCPVATAVYYVLCTVEYCKVHSLPS